MVLLPSPRSAGIVAIFYMPFAFGPVALLAGMVAITISAKHRGARRSGYGRRHASAGLRRRLDRGLGIQRCTRDLPLVLPRRPAGTPALVQNKGSRCLTSTA